MLKDILVVGLKFGASVSKRGAVVWAQKRRAQAKESEF